MGVDCSGDAGDEYGGVVTGVEVEAAPAVDARDVGCRGFDGEGIAIAPDSVTAGRLYLYRPTVSAHRTGDEAVTYTVPRPRAVLRCSSL